MKKKYKILLILLAVGMLAVAARDHLAYHYAISSCRSDNLAVVKHRLEELETLPNSVEEVRPLFQRTVNGRTYDNFVCHASKKPFVWRPEGIRTRDGRPVIVMCPLGSHGFLRKYSWGLIPDGDHLCFVKVLASGEVVADSLNDGGCKQVPR